MYYRRNYIYPFFLFKVYVFILRHENLDYTRLFFFLILFANKNSFFILYLEKNRLDFFFSPIWNFPNPTAGKYHAPLQPEFEAIYEVFPSEIWKLLRIRKSRRMYCHLRWMNFRFMRVVQFWKRDILMLKFFCFIDLVTSTKSENIFFGQLLDIWSFFLNMPIGLITMANFWL